VKLGSVLHEITNPIVMALIFYSTIVPIGIVLRLLRHDSLRLRWDVDLSSYWIDRKPPDCGTDSMKAQF
jgi:hypothetical protein